MEDKPQVFILGCERSGSTWLSNIFDAHPEIELYMEPFADYAQFFPGLPSRTEYLDTFSNLHLDVLEAGYAKLYAAKYPGLYRPGRGLSLKFLDQAYFSLRSQIARKPRLKILRYHLLNMHSSRLPMPLHPRKSAQSCIDVTKELRLNLKTQAIAQAFPEAKMLITIRHPGAQIDSIKHWIAKGNLVELVETMDAFFSTVTSHLRFHQYLEALNQLNWQEDMEDRLIAWWVISYDVLLRDLEQIKQPHYLIQHEKLSQAPLAQIKALFDFIEIEMHRRVENYLKISTSYDSRKSPVDTFRRSQEDSQSKIAAVSPEFMANFDRFIEPLKLAPELRNYLKELT